MQSFDFNLRLPAVIIIIIIYSGHQSLKTAVRVRYVYNDNGLVKSS